METRRESKLPVSGAVARQRLVNVFVSTVVVQKVNLLPSRIICTGGFAGDTLTVQYTEYGRGMVSCCLTGHIANDRAGSRLLMTVSNDTLSIPHYVPFLIWIRFGH